MIVMSMGQIKQTKCANKWQILNCNLYSNTWNDLTVCKKNIGYFNMCLQIIYLICLYKQDSALNGRYTVNLTQPTTNHPCQLACFLDLKQFYFKQFSWAKVHSVLFTHSSISNNSVLHFNKIKWFQVMQYITNNSIKHQSFVYIQLNVKLVLFQTTQFSISTQFLA